MEQRQEVTNFARFYGLFKRLPKVGVSEGELKGQLVAQFTNGRTHSLRQVTSAEYERLCQALERETNGATQMMARLVYSAELKKSRSACLHQMQRMGIATTDWQRVNAFCQDARIAGHAFRGLDIQALKDLLVKLRAIARRGGLKRQSAAGEDEATKGVRKAVEEHSKWRHVAFSTETMGEA